MLKRLNAVKKEFLEMIVDHGTANVKDFYMSLPMESWLTFKKRG